MHKMASKFGVGHSASRSRAFGVQYPAIQSRAFGVGQPAIWTWVHGSNDQGLTKLINVN